MPAFAGRTLPITNQAANQGYVEGEFRLGRLLVSKAGGDLNEAIAFLRDAANRGDLRAQFSIGLLNEQGRGVPQSYVEAAKCIAGLPTLGPPRHS